MTTEDHKLLAQMEQHSKEMMVSLLHCLVLLATKQAGEETASVLGRRYRLAALPETNEVKISPLDE